MGKIFIWITSSPSPDDWVEKNSLPRVPDASPVFHQARKEIWDPAQNILPTFWTFVLELGWSQNNLLVPESNNTPRISIWMWNRNRGELILRNGLLLLLVIRPILVIDQIDLRGLQFKLTRDRFHFRDQFRLKFIFHKVLNENLLREIEL